MSQVMLQQYLEIRANRQTCVFMLTYYVIITVDWELKKNACKEILCKLYALSIIWGITFVIDQFLTVCLCVCSNKPRTGCYDKTWQMKTQKVLLKDYIFYFDIKSAAAEFFASPKSCLLICRWFNAAKVIGEDSAKGLIASKYIQIWCFALHACISFNWLFTETWKVFIHNTW